MSLLNDESKVLIIYTGGTIGMLVGNKGYVPEPYFLTETLRSQSRFHDPQQNSLFSHSGSVTGFRKWNSSSGRASPRSASPSGTPPSQPEPTLIVRSCRPIGSSASLGLDEQVAARQPGCAMVSENIYEAHIPSLVTPRSAVPAGTGTKSIRYAVLEVGNNISCLLLKSPQS